MARKNTNEGGGDEVDKISSLPDHLIHQIFMSFDMNHFVQTSVLSKNWRYVWKSHPFLYFNLDPYFSVDTPVGKGFLDFMNNVILFRDKTSDIQSFHLFHNGANIHSNFKKWILTALSRNVKDLYLNFHHRPQDIFSQLPHSQLFTCQSLEKLELHNTDGNDPVVLKLPDSISLPMLKTLVLQGFQFEYSEDVANNIFSSCMYFPVLESLILLGCAFDTTIGIRISGPQLKRLIIKNSPYSYYISEEYGGDKYPIHLCAPNLILLICKDRYLWRDYSIDNLSALTKADIELGSIICNDFEDDEIPYSEDEKRKLCSQRMVMFLRAVLNVGTLKLRASFIMALSGDTAIIESMSPIQFCNLRCLELKTRLSAQCINSITYLLKISPNIESISLTIQCNDMWPFDSEKLEVHWEAGVSLRHLKDVEIRGAEGRINELLIMKILLKKAIVLENVTLYTPSPDKLPPNQNIQQEKIDQKLQALPRASSNAKFTVLEDEDLN